MKLTAEGKQNNDINSLAQPIGKNTGTGKTIKKRGMEREVHVILVNEGWWAPSPSPQLCDGWLVDEVHKSRLYQASAPSALNCPYCSW
uniref:Uncharacterized protein n=1 Tax=Arundo donax TaxID=35708 RepID=A0A0A9E8L8_ARUDO